MFSCARQRCNVQSKNRFQISVVSHCRQHDAAIVCFQNEIRIPIPMIFVASFGKLKTMWQRHRRSYGKWGKNMGENKKREVNGSAPANIFLPFNAKAKITADSVRVLFRIFFSHSYCRLIWIIPFNVHETRLCRSQFGLPFIGERSVLRWCCINNAEFAIRVRAVCAVCSLLLRMCEMLKCAIIASRSEPDRQTDRTAPWMPLKARQHNKKKPFCRYS